MYKPRNPEFVKKVTDSFALQSAMATFGMRLGEINPGEVHILMEKAANMTQQQGFIHGGVLTTGLDSACGYSALSLAPAECEVLTIELKTSFLAPAGHRNIIFIGKVIKPGRRAVFTEGEAYGYDDDSDARTLVAKISATMTLIDIS